MLKFLKIFFLTVLVLIIVIAVGLFIFLKNFDVNQYKATLLTQVNKASGQQIDAGQIDLAFSLQSGLSLNIADIRLGQEPSFGEGYVLDLKKARMNLDVKRFITAREIVVKDIELVRPIIRIAKNPAGQLNIRGVAPTAADTSATLPEAATTTSPSEPATAAPAATPAPAAVELPKIMVQTVRVTDAVAVYEDRSMDPPILVNVDKIHFEVNNFSLLTPFTFSAGAAVFSDNENVSVTGQAWVDAIHQEGRISETVLKVNIDTLSLDKMMQAVPALASAKIIKKVNGQLRVSVKQLIAGAKGLSVLAAEGELSSGQVDVDYQNTSLEDMRATFTLTEDLVDLKDFSFKVNGGTVTTTAKVRDYLKAPDISAEVKTDAVALGPLMPKFDENVSFDGALSLQSAVKTKAGADGDFVKPLTGTGNVAVANGRLVNLNVLKMILDKISIIPNMYETVQSKIPAKYQDQLSRNDTIFQALTTKFHIENAKVVVDEALCQSDTFSLEAAGNVGFDQQAEFTATVFIPKDLSASLIEGSQELSGLKDLDGRIRIPLTKYEGPVAKMMLYPDIGYIGKNIATQKGTDELKKVIYKALGRDEEPVVPTPTQPADPTAPAPATQPTEEPKKSSEDQMIDSVIDGVMDIFNR
jgi:uncharacterized protein involved in outer membrane biogenesis